MGNDVDEGMHQQSLEAAVIEAVPDPLARITTREIGPLFGRGPSWMERGEVRQKLFSDGFPRPISRGVWIKRDVVRFILRRSAGAEPAVPSNTSRLSTEDFVDVMERTRRFLEERRKRRRGGKAHRRSPI